MQSQLITAFKKAARPAGPTLPGMPGHDVHFYRTEAHHTRIVVDFLAAGIRAGQPLVVIATEVHRRAFAEELAIRGLDTEEILSGREVVWLDARQTLEAFMEGGLPDRELFMATIGSVFERVLKKRNYLVVRGYGEMVDVLWKEGRAEGAMQLEVLWNELAVRYAYSLLCGYSVGNFLHDAGPEQLRRVCDHHTHTLPLELTT